MLRILFLGQKPLGERIFMEILSNWADQIEVLGVVSNEELNPGWWNSWKIKDQAQKMNLSYISNKNRNNDLILEFIKKNFINCILSVQHPWVIPTEILQSVNYQAFNIHMAKLPQYQGWNSFSHAILNGDQSYTTTIHWIVEKLDAGNICLEKSIHIEQDDTAFSLYKKCEEVSFNLYKKFLSLLILDNVPSIPLVGKEQFYKKNDLNFFKEVDIKKIHLDELYTRVRALYFPPFEPVWTIVNSQKIYLVPEVT